MIGIIGGGSWATALAKILLEDPMRRVAWWVRDAGVAEALARTGHNPRYLTSTALDATRLTVSSNLTTIAASSSTILIAVPSSYVVPVMRTLPNGLLKDKNIVSATKGYVPSEGCSITQFLREQMLIPTDRLCIVSGPSHAEEVAQGMHTYLAVASHSEMLSHEVAQVLRCPYIHPVVSTEMEAIELCGMVKNVYAIAAGMMVGIGGGDNLIASFTAAAATEMERLTGKVEPRIASVGDLVATCFSAHSRNRSLGIAVAQGVEPAAHFERTGMVAEGYSSSLTMHRLFDATEAPIAEAVYRVLYTHSNPTDEIRRILDILY